MKDISLYEYMTEVVEHDWFWVALGTWLVLFGLSLCLVAVGFVLDGYCTCRAKLVERFRGVSGLPRARLLARKRLRRNLSRVRSK